MLRKLNWRIPMAARALHSSGVSISRAHMYSGKALQSPCQIPGVSHNIPSAGLGTQLLDYLTSRDPSSKEDSLPFRNPRVAQRPWRSQHLRTKKHPSMFQSSAHTALKGVHIVIYSTSTQARNNSVVGRVCPKVFSLVQLEVHSLYRWRDRLYANVIKI